MYCHLLVPIDGTDLSVQVVGNAVALARSLDARITFFHAMPDGGSLLQGDAELLRATARGEFDYASHGKARELLAKAEAAARALGVPCTSRQAASDRPAHAVIEVARASGCDLIFMASHGHSKLAMLFGSETLAVLMNAGLPVLVSSTGELQPPARAIAIIRDEHRSLAAVMHAWLHALAEARQAGSAVDPAAMRAMLRYLQEFSLQRHHPKEDQHLFALLRQRTTSCHAELAAPAMRRHEDQVALGGAGGVDDRGGGLVAAALHRVARHAAGARRGLGLGEQLARPAGVGIGVALGRHGAHHLGIVEEVRRRVRHRVEEGDAGAERTRQAHRVADDLDGQVGSVDRNEQVTVHGSPRRKAGSERS